MVLATLSRVSNDPMYEHLAGCARSMDTDMLMSALKEGVFAVPMDVGIGRDNIADSPELYHDKHTTGQAVVDSAPQVLKSFASVYSVFEKVDNLSVNEDENGNDLKMSVSVAKLYASDAFSEFFSALVKGFLEDRNSVLANGAHMETSSTEKSKNREAVAKRVFRDTSVGLMALACALDKPAELKALIEGVPGGLHAVGSAQYGGHMNAPGLQGLGNGRTDQENCRYAAPFFAIHYSSAKCLDVVLDAGWKAHEPFARFKREDPSLNEETDSDDPLKKWNSQTSASSLGLVEVINADAAYFTPAMMAKSLNAMPNEFGSWREVDRHALSANMRERMNPDNELSYGYMPAMLTTDLLDWDIAASLETAAECGAIEVFEKYADRMPWDQLLGSSDRNVLALVLGAEKYEEEPEHFVAVADRIVEMALEEDETRIFDLHVDEQSKVEPLEQIVKLGLAPLLLQFMKNGLRQDTEIEGTDKTLRSILEEAGDEALAHVVKTYETRQRAMSALSEIENDHAPAPVV